MIEERNKLFKSEFVIQWKTEDNHKTKYISDDDNNLICIVFTHTTNGYNVLDYIYTFEKYRRAGYALKLLKQLQNEELSANCDCIESEKLFEKAKWIYIGTLFNKIYVTQKKYVKKYTLDMNRIKKMLNV